jgi:hypothetical protein
MNQRYYIDKLSYNLGEAVIYLGKHHKIVHIHEDGLVNLEDGWFYILGVNKNMLYKVDKLDSN